MEYATISKEDLLLRISKMKAELSAIKVERGKDKALIDELTHQAYIQSQEWQKEIDAKKMVIQNLTEKITTKNKLIKKLLYEAKLSRGN